MTLICWQKSHQNIRNIEIIVWKSIETDEVVIKILEILAKIVPKLLKNVEIALKYMFKMSWKLLKSRPNYSKCYKNWLKTQKNYTFHVLYEPIFIETQQIFHIRIFDQTLSVLHHFYTILNKLWWHLSYFEQFYRHFIAFYSFFNNF